jgi:hypothetical protein
MNTNENRTMTVRDAVESIIKDLGEIPVPISHMETVGFPIARSIQNLKIICAAWDAEEAEKRGKENAGGNLNDEINAVVQEAVRQEQEKENGGNGVDLKVVPMDAPEEEQANE